MYKLPQCDIKGCHYHICSGVKNTKVKLTSQDDIRFRNPRRARAIGPNIKHLVKLTAFFNKSRTLDKFIEVDDPVTVEIEKRR